MELQELLERSGFSDKESKVYQALISLGVSGVSSIAKNAAINRSTAYVVLDTLTKRGLVASGKIRGVKKFYPLPPKKLLTELQEAAERSKDTAKAARKILADLKLEIPVISGSAPKIRFFSGADEMKKMFASAVDSLEMIRASAKADVQVMGDTVVVFSAQKKSGIIIESAQIAQSLREAFGA